MSASCELTLTFHGTDDDFEKIINKIYEIEGKSRTENLILPLIQIDGHKITAYNGMCHNIWGNNYLYPDVDMYMEFAKLVPDAAFDIDSYRVNEVGGGGAETYLKVSYKNRILNFDILSGVDDISFPFIVAEMYAEYCGHEVHVATAGKSKLFDSILDLEEYFSDNPEKYSSLHDIIDQEYTVSLNNYVNNSITRFKETYRLAKSKSNLSVLESLNFAKKVFKIDNVQPVVIAACSSIDELSSYIDCLENNKLNSFEYFKIINQ